MDPEQAAQLLARERGRIELALERLRGGEREETPDLQEPGEAGSGLYQSELDEGLEEDLVRQLHALERAEERLQAGTYGLSVESGDRIDEARLRALPLAERTVEEERRLG